MLHFLFLFALLFTSCARKSPEEKIAEAIIESSQTGPSPTHVPTPDDLTALYNVDWTQQSESTNQNHSNGEHLELDEYYSDKDYVILDTETDRPDLCRMTTDTLKTRYHLVIYSDREMTINRGDIIQTNFNNLLGFYNFIQIKKGFNFIEYQKINDEFRTEIEIRDICSIHDKMYCHFCNVILSKMKMNLKIRLIEHLNYIFFVKNILLNLCDFKFYNLILTKLKNFFVIIQFFK